MNNRGHINDLAVRTRAARCAFVLGSALLLSACGGDDGDGGSSGGGAGTVSDTWREYCVATIIEDTAVTDFFGDPLFTARAGDEYLVLDFRESTDEDRATLAYLTPAGPYDFELTAALGTRDFPFTTSCDLDAPSKHYAVFTDVTLYAAEDLATEICSLSAGSTVPLDGTNLAGFSATDLSFTGPATYEVFLNAFGAQCGGAESGFISVPQTQVLGVQTHIVPIQGIVGG